MQIRRVNKATSYNQGILKRLWRVKKSIEDVDEKADVEAMLACYRCHKFIDILSREIQHVSVEQKE